MPRITLARSLDEAGLVARCTPRNDIVGERVAASTSPPGRVRFVQADGPFVRYERVVEPGDVDPRDPTRRLVHETIEFELPTGTWRFLMHRPISLTLRRNPRDGRMPWWAPTQRPDPRAATVLGLLATLSLTLGYLSTLLGRTMTFAADEFHAGNTAQSVVLSTARVGALLAVVLTALADRKGRRLLLLVSLLTCIGSTALGAVTPNLAGLAASQAVNRGALAAGGVLLGIIVAEEMPAGARAYAVSLLAMTGALGAGMALWILPLADLGEQAWRILYAVPLLMIPMVVHFARLLPETLRYLRPHREVAIKGRVSRLWLLATAMFLFNIFNGPVPQFQNEFLRDERGFSAGAISLFVVATSTPGGIGIVAGGRLAETIGRRAVAAFALIVGTVLVAAQFALSGPAMWIAAMLGAVVSAAVVPSVTVYWPELFPTSLRGKANGLVGMAASGGSVVGLLAIGVLADAFGSFGATMPVVAIGPLLMAVLIVAKFPETAHRELEDINPEDLRVDDTTTPTSPRKPSPSPR
ncbi:MAG: MFS transporter [Acidimicrobiales bacterium]